jgi:hypothetical protein
MAIDKSTWNKKVKVSQSTIDDIKRLGMSKALRLAKENAGATQAGLVAEYQEATRRLYGDRRFAAATGSLPKKAAPKPANPKQADRATPKKASTSYSPQKMSPTAQATTRWKQELKKAPAKKSGGVSNTAKVVAGTAAAIGILAVTRGRGTGAIAKVAPGFSRSGIGKVLTGTGKPFVPKGLGPKVSTNVSTAAMKAKDAAAAARGRISAKTTKSVSQSQYDAMVASAKAKGIKPSNPKQADKAVTKAVAKTAAPAASKAKTAAQQLVNRGNVRWDATAPKPKPTKPKK